MPIEVTSVFGANRLNHIDQVALAGDLRAAAFDTKDFGEVTIERGDETRPGFRARSEGFNVTVIIGPDGDQAAIVTYDMNPIVITGDDRVADLREQVDKMLQQCNNVTRR